MRLGIFGGTFDPVHLGHLLLAECCREACALDRVWFLPAAVPPHKQGRQPAPAEARVEMLELAVAGHPAFEVCTLEIDRGGVNYTYQTLEQIRAQQPGAALYFLMGGDSLADLPTWREPARICELAEIVAVSRPGAPEPDWSRLAGIVSPERLAHFQGLRVECPQIDISSTDIRARAAEGRSIRYRTPRAVEKYIEARGLYRQG